MIMSATMTDRVDAEHRHKETRTAETEEVMGKNSNNKQTKASRMKVHVVLFHALRIFFFFFF